MESAPKKPMTAYFHFFRKHREGLTKDHPELGLAKYSRLCGEMWKNLPEEERTVYQNAAEEDKARYQMELAQYNRGK